MNARGIALILVAVLMLLALAVPVAGEPQQEIPVIGADFILTPEVGESPPPDVEMRVVAAYANEILREDLEAMPTPPPVPQRVVAAYANEILRAALAPADFEWPVPERIVFAYANANLHPELVYPCELMCDTTPPAISDVAVEISSSSAVTITWTTDEFADSEVLYGEETGQHTGTVSDDTLVKEHEIGLIGLSSETTYYYRVCSTDRCDNGACSPEYSFEVSYIYLPLVLRDSP